MKAFGLRLNVYRLALWLVLATALVACGRSCKSEPTGAKGQKILPPAQRPTAIAAVNRGLYRYQYIDQDGTELTTTDHFEVLDYAEGLGAMRKTSTHWFFVDAWGKEAIAPRYGRVSPFTDGHSLTLIAPEPGKVETVIIDRKGTVVRHVDYEGFSDFHDDRMLVHQANAESNALGRRNKPGDPGKWGYIDRALNEVIPLELERANDFGEKVAAVMKEDRWQLIDLSGAKVMDLEGSDAFVFRDGLLPVKRGERWGYVDHAGKLVIPAVNKEPRRFQAGRAVLVTDTGVGLIDREGKEILKPTLLSIDELVDGVALACEAQAKCGAVDHDGKTVVPFEWDLIDTLSEGLVIVKRGSLYGYVDRTGRVALAPQYDSARRFSQGLAFVTKGKTHGYIDKTGTMKITLDDNSYGREFVSVRE